MHQTTAPAPTKVEKVIRVLVVDDHAVIRRGVREILALETDLEVCGEAANGQEAIDQTKELHPDVVLMDLSMPGMSGYDAALSIRQSNPDVKLIVFSTHPKEVMEKMVRPDAFDGFVGKQAGTVNLIEVLRSVL